MSKDESIDAIKKRLEKIRLDKIEVDQSKNIIVEVEDFPTFITVARELRIPDTGQEYWSFRGQRDCDNILGISRKFKSTFDLKFIKKNKNEINTRIDALFNVFCKRCQEFPQPDYLHEENTWNWLFYAQHYGLKTRLVDWSTNPLVALYFAVSSNPHNRDTKDKKDGVVWALKVENNKVLKTEELKECKPGLLKEWTLVAPPPITSRLARQSGKFTYHPDPFLDIATEKREDVIFVKIKIKKPKKKDNEKPNYDRIKKQLGIMNIHQASLFPDADGVARFVNNEWHKIVIWDEHHIIKEE